MSPITLTPHGVSKLKNELEHLKKQRRPEITERIRHAKEYGDLSENAEYHDAKEEQAFVEGRILEIEAILKTATVVIVRHSDTIVIGSRVVIANDGMEKTFEIVGSTEADPATGKISIDSPLGSALIDKRPGDTVELKTPNGVVIYTIKEFTAT